MMTEACVWPHVGGSYSVDSWSYPSKLGWVCPLSKEGYQFSVRNRDELMNAPCPHKWWSTLNSDFFGSSSSFPHVGGIDGLVCESVCKAGLMSANFDSKQSMDSVDLPSTCHPSPSLTTVAVWSWEVIPPLWCHWPIRYVAPLSEEDSWCSSPSFRCGVSAFSSFGQIRCSLEIGWRHPNSERLTLQLQTNSHNTCTVQDVSASGIILSLTVYGMQRCASSYPVRLSERS